MTLHIVDLRGQRIHGIAQGLNAGIRLYLLRLGASLDLAQQRMGAIQGEEADRNACQDQTAKNAEGDLIDWRLNFLLRKADSSSLRFSE